MVKKFTFLFLLGILGLFTSNLFAQEDATIDPANIRYWIGEGENEVVFIVNWNEPDTALAWGYRFDEETITVKDMMLEIQVADNRFGFNGATFVDDITFNDGVLNLGITEGGYFMYNVNGVMAGEGFSTQTIVNGNYVKWGDTNCGTMVDPSTWAYVWETPVQPVSIYDAVEEVEAAKLSVYPNPASETLYVNVENVQLVEIYDMAGRIVLTSVNPVVDLNGVEAGVYFVTVRTENAVKTTKLVVK